MSKQRTKPELLDFGDAFLTALGFGVCGLFAGLVVGIGLDIFGVHFNGSSTAVPAAWGFWLMVHGSWVGAVIGLISVGVTNASVREQLKEIERAEEGQRQAELAARDEGIRRAEERKRNEDRQERERCLARIHDACENSIAGFEMLPIDLKNAYDWLLVAQQHFGNNAYSPFWQAIENAYFNLGNFNLRVDYIETMARQYSEAVRDYRKAGGGDRIPLFPVKMDTVNAARAWESIANVADSVVYRAQCEAVFAQIWEQRRTTSAVVAGFANLEQAVAGLAHSVQASVNLLASTLNAMPADMGPESNEAKLRMNQAAQSLHSERWRASPLS